MQDGDAHSRGYAAAGADASAQRGRQPAGGTGCHSLHNAGPVPHPARQQQ